MAWPIDADLEQKVRKCLVCQSTQKAPAKSPMHPWEWPEKPWARLYIDHAGPVLGKTLLITVDAHSKWIDAHIVSSTSSAATIEKLRATFATHSLPQTVVSDNDPAFTSSELLEFMQCNGIEHLRSTQYHPSSNGLAERAVQTVKTGVQKLTAECSGVCRVRMCKTTCFAVSPVTWTELITISTIVCFLIA